jgi:hypothetical protein
LIDIRGRQDFFAFFDPISQAAARIHTKLDQYRRSARRIVDVSARLTAFPIGTSFVVK